MPCRASVNRDRIRFYWAALWSSVGGGRSKALPSGGVRQLEAADPSTCAPTAGGQSTCKNHTHKYASGGCHNKSFTVRRCAAAGENLADYFTVLFPPPPQPAALPSVP